MAGKRAANPRILIVTPEVTYLPDGMGNAANFLTAKAGGLADVSAALISALFDEGADVHVALPDYRAMFSNQLGPILQKELEIIRTSMPEERIHLAEDRAFYYLARVYSDYNIENIKIALAFQREVINNIIPHVQPDLIHCNDWMTGLIPGMARRLGIPCLLTIHNVHTMRATLATIEDRGIDAAAFWQTLFYTRPPLYYEETRDQNPVDFLTSGIFASHFVNTVSATFLEEIVQGWHDFIEPSIRQEIRNKYANDCAAGILNAPDPSYNPDTDMALARRYTVQSYRAGKRENKRFFQKSLRLIEDDQAPLFFWPSRLDNVQKGCQLLADILFELVSRYWDRHLQVVFVANGDFKVHFQHIVARHGLFDRVKVCNFDERLSRLAYAASDFILMPSRFEPCGLPQMIGPLYGSLTVAHNTGGLRDTVTHLDIEGDTGNGFLFNTYDPQGLFWAMEQALNFFFQPPSVKHRHLKRIITEASKHFTHEVTARQYIDLYEKMLDRPLIIDQASTSDDSRRNHDQQ